MGALLQDLRYAARVLLKQRGFTLVALLAVAGVVLTVKGIPQSLASYIPARRATKVDPMIALRYE